MKATPDDRLAGPGHAWRAGHQIHIQTPNNCDACSHAFSPFTLGNRKVRPYR
jgi:hypothetical protein